jgi:hypothetical protein
MALVASLGLCVLEMADCTISWNENADRAAVLTRKFPG